MYSSIFVTFAFCLLVSFPFCVLFRVKSRARLTDLSFHAAAPKIWSDLTCSIGNIEPLNRFK